MFPPPHCDANSSPFHTKTLLSLTLANAISWTWILTVFKICLKKKLLISIRLRLSNSFKFSMTQSDPLVVAEVFGAFVKFLFRPKNRYKSVFIFENRNLARTIVCLCPHCCGFPRKQKGRMKSHIKRVDAPRAHLANGLQAQFLQICPKHFHFSYFTSYTEDLENAQHLRSSSSYNCMDKSGKTPTIHKRGTANPTKPANAQL